MISASSVAHRGDTTYKKDHSGFGVPLPQMGRRQADRQVGPRQTNRKYHSGFGLTSPCHIQADGRQTDR